MLKSMTRFLLLSICVLLASTLAANAYTVPLYDTDSGQVQIGTLNVTRTADGSWDELTVNLASFTGIASGYAINEMVGTFSGDSTASMALYSGTSWVGKTTNQAFRTNGFYTDAQSMVNFDATASNGSNPFARTGSGTSYTSFTSNSASNFSNASAWSLSADPVNDVLTPTGSTNNVNGIDQTLLGNFFVTPGGNFNYVGQLGFTFGGGTLVNAKFDTLSTPEPSTLLLLVSGLLGLAAYAWKKRK